MLEDGHHHLVIPPPVVPDGLATPALLDESRLLVSAQASRVERGYVELDAVQAHLAEAVVDDHPHRVRTVAAADMVTAERDADRRASVLGPSPPQPEVADQHRRVVERLDGKAYVVLLIGAPLGNALLGPRFGGRYYPVRQRGHPPRIHLPLGQRRQVVIAYTAKPHQRADEDRVAISECGIDTSQLRHGLDLAACPLATTTLGNAGRLSAGPTAEYVGVQPGDYVLSRHRSRNGTEKPVLAIRPNWECCDRDLAPDALDIWICSFECTWCTD